MDGSRLVSLGRRGSVALVQRSLRAVNVSFSALKRISELLPDAAGSLKGLVAACNRLADRC